MGALRLSLGSLFADRFEVQALAGSGGMGTVYRARDRSSGNVVALKLLLADTSDAEDTQRFSREAQLLSELDHPGIVAHVANGQTADGQRFLAMEWLDGEDLGQRLTRGPLPLHDCLCLLNQVADALSVAHERDIIHRDIKPSDLFLSGGDVAQVKLLDFGIARRISTAPQMTRTGMLIGTPAYMAPEQARGVRELTPATDLFSLGCVLYECLTGQTPFAADHVAAVLVRILLEEAAPIEDVRPGVPAPLVALLGRLLEKDPAVRLADGNALKTELATLRELSEAQLIAMGTRSKPHATNFAENEQSLFSVVLAALSEESASSNTMLLQDGLLQASERQLLVQALGALGASCDFLANEALVVTIPSMGSATDQATRAARAALLIKERWPAAVVSMATGRGAMHGWRAVGEVVEQAARSLKTGNHRPLAGAAVGVFVDKLSAKLLEGRFSQTPKPGGALLIGEELEADASRPLLGRPTPCVGRETELATLEVQLIGCIEEAEARVMLVTAPAGIGKSRLRHEFMRRVQKRRELITVLSGRGDLMSIGTPYGILRTAILKLCSISGSEPLGMQRERLRLRIGQYLDEVNRERVVLFIGELCNTPFPEDGKPLLQAARHEPKIMRDCLNRALLDWLAAECAVASVVLVLDDLHWSDELTVLVVDQALREQSEARLLVLGFARPEVHEVFPKLWQDHKVQEISLRGLSKKSCERLVQQVLGKDISPPVIARVVEQSSGNALYLEELIRSIAEGEPEAQPETMVAMLQARIGRLDAGARRAVRAAAVFGQTFWQGGVAAVLGLPKNSSEVKSWLASVAEAELIALRPDSRLVDEREYGFRHALVCNAAYGLLTESDLRTGHQSAGDYLEGAGERDAAIVAEHYERGGDKIRATRSYVRAAESALSGYFMESAMRWVERGIACGAEGELLGTLRAIESVALFHRGRIDLAFPAAMAAIPFVRPGSRAWGWALYGACTAALIGPIQWRAEFPVLSAQLLQHSPESDAEHVYVEALFYVCAVMSTIWPPEQNQQLLLVLEDICDRAAGRNPLLRRYFLLGQSFGQVFWEPKPWTLLKTALEGSELALQAGDLPNLALALGLQVGILMKEIGNGQGALDLLGTNMASIERIQQVVPKATARLQACAITVSREETSPDELAQAVVVAGEVLDLLKIVPLYAIFAHDLLARIYLKQGKFPDAESEARRASFCPGAAPSHKLHGYSTLIRVLLTQKKTDEAVAIAIKAYSIIKRYGRCGSSEVELRLAISEAFYSDGKLERAYTEIRETLRQIQLRADDINDPFWKNSYYTRNPYCARARNLAKEWGIA